MKTAVLALTDQGASIAQKIKNIMEDNIEFYPPQRFGKLRDLVPQIWREYQALVFVMAAGIVVRQIAPLIKGKDRDPAVIVIDENGEYVIPILSGHLGGANFLAKILAQELKALPVITTATDLRGLTAPDEYARRLKWKVYPLTKLPQVNSKLLRKNKIIILSEYELENNHPFRNDSNYEFTTDKDKADIIISSSPNGERCLYLIPPLYSVGIGCRKGTTQDEILLAIDMIFKDLDCSIKSIKGLYSISVKADEQGLLKAAEALGVVFCTFSIEQIQETIEKYNLERSPWVRESIGVEGVCEPASILGSNNGQLIIHKTRVGKVTIAVCQEKFLL